MLRQTKPRSLVAPLATSQSLFQTLSTVQTLHNVQLLQGRLTGLTPRSPHVRHSHKTRHDLTRYTKSYSARPLHARRPCSKRRRSKTQHILTLTLSKRRTVERASRGSGRLSSHTRDLVLIRLGPIRLVDVTETTCVPAAAAFLRLDDVRQQLLHRRCELLETVLP